MQCYNAGSQSICCENLDSAAAAPDAPSPPEEQPEPSELPKLVAPPDDQLPDTPVNPLKYRPEHVQRIQEELEAKIKKHLHKVTKIQKARPAPPLPPSPTPPTTRSSPRPLPKEPEPEEQASQSEEYEYSDEMILTTIGQPVTTPEPETRAPEPSTRRPRNRSRNLALAAVLAQPETKIGDEPVNTAEYKPHPSGGYAVRKIKKNHRRPEQKLLAQQYLLEQIKNGWPYDEKFYRLP